MKKFFAFQRRATLLVALCCVMVVSSCEEKPQLRPSSGDSVSDQGVYNQILKLGFRKENIVDRGDYYLVEGDIRFDKRPKGSKNARPAHSFYSLGVASTEIGSVSVRVDNSYTNSTWRQLVIDATNDAINSWNNISTSGIELTYTSGNSADITIKYDSNLQQGFLGDATWPSNCQPGIQVALNYQTENVSQTQLHFLIAHELGHCMGFRHTDEGSTDPDATHIYSTPYTESNSVMNSGSAWGYLPTWPGFTTGDVLAASQLYPSAGANVVVVNTNSGNGYPIRVTWTTSHFCNSQVHVDIYDGTTFVKGVPGTGTTNNNGVFYFSTSGLTSNYNYEYRVYVTGDEGNMLYSNIALSF